MAWSAIIFAQKYGDIQETPLTIEIEENRIRDLQCENKELLEEFRAYTSTDENSNRVGEFAVGTNTACTHVIGNILQDEKIPGIHIAFGHPYAEHTGANWISKTHIDCVGRDFDIWFDDVKVMEAGKFLVLRLRSGSRSWIRNFERAFNADFSAEKYDALLRCVNETEKWPADFRVSETPIFLTDEFTERSRRAPQMRLLALTPHARNSSEHSASAHSARAWKCLANRRIRIFSSSILGFAPRAASSSRA